MTRSRSSTASSSSDPEVISFMEEPTSFRPASPPPTSVPYTRRELGGNGEMQGDEEVEVHLVNGHALWGHVLYPAAIALSRFLELHSATLLRADPKTGRKGKNVVELGAGGGLPGLVAGLEGARVSVISDFPDPALVKNLEKNVALLGGTEGKTEALGFTWGAPVAPLFASLGPSEKFDLILLSDIVFNHSQHSALLDSCLSLLSDAPPTVSAAVDTTKEQPMDLSTPSSLVTPAILCFYSHHRPTQELIAADLGFLTMAKAKGFKVQRVWKDQGAGPAFPADKGDYCIRSTVHGWMFTRSEEGAVEESTSE